MGHQSNEAHKALRAYARDLQANAERGGLSSFAGTSKQDDASVQFSGSGAPHQLAMVAAAVCVVLLGGTGFAIATNSTSPTKSRQTISVSAQPSSVTAVFARTGSIPTSQAIQAFHDLGMTKTVEALRAATDAGVDSSTGVTNALSNLFRVVEEKLQATGHVSESDIDVAIALMSLTDAVRPPGLDSEWLAPGNGGEAPGQDPSWTAPGKTDGFVGPGTDPAFVAPGQEPDFVPPKPDSEPGATGDTAPGRTNDSKPDKGQAKNSGDGKP